MTFGTLALLIAAGLAGPALALVAPGRMPVVVGQIAAGVVLGTSGFDVIDATDPTTAFLGRVGFGLLMFVAGTHVPLRAPGLRPALRRGVLATALTGCGAVAVAALLADPLGLPTAILALPLATSSAAIVLPLLREHRAVGDVALFVLAWVTVADVVTIVVLPLGLAQRRAADRARPGRRRRSRPRTAAGGAGARRPPRGGAPAEAIPSLRVGARPPPVAADPRDAGLRRGALVDVDPGRRLRHRPGGGGDRRAAPADAPGARHRARLLHPAVLRHARRPPRCPRPRRRAGAGAGRGGDRDPPRRRAAAARVAGRRARRHGDARRAGRGGRARARERAHRRRPGRRHHRRRAGVDRRRRRRRRRLPAEEPATAATGTRDPAP